MKYPLIIISVLFITPAFTPGYWLAAKSHNEVIIESASQFQKWCKSLSYRHFRQLKQQPYNWSASTFRQLNDYQTSGSWKVDNTERRIICQIRIGKKANQTKMEIR